MQSFISSEQYSNDFIHINSCGCQHFCGISAGSTRPYGRIDYHILYISKGVCHITVHGEDKVVSEGSLIFFLPHEPQIYYFNKDTESISYYVHFSGTFCDSILSSLGLRDCKILNMPKDSHIESIFAQLVGEFNVKKPFYEQSCQGIFISMLSAIARKNSYSISGNVQRNKLMFDICNIMHEHYAENISIDRYAKMASLSSSRFIHAFTETIGISPKQYLLQIKFERAIELLSNTDLSVAQISELVGISDGNYFSRIFKKHTGHPPGFYR
ncbi:MAG: AraC family transcriptional regulator [Clostridiales bacterium]|nr:AraC family transcriptional regulator [Clostridiales bacterium]